MFRSSSIKLSGGFLRRQVSQLQKPRFVQYDRKTATEQGQLASALGTAKDKTKFAATQSEDLQQKEKKKTMAELDEELRQKLEGISGFGGDAGIELENGKPVAMKRGVKSNMFRVI